MIFATIAWTCYIGIHSLKDFLIGDLVIPKKSPVPINGVDEPCQARSSAASLPLTRLWLRNYVNSNVKWEPTFKTSMHFQSNLESTLVELIAVAVAWLFENIATLLPTVVYLSTSLTQ